VVDLLHMLSNIATLLLFLVFPSLALLVVDVQKALSVHACFPFCNFSYQRPNCIFPAKMKMSVLPPTICGDFGVLE